MNAIHQYTTPKVLSRQPSNFKPISNASNTSRKNTKKQYGTHWQPLYILISNIFRFWSISFIDDFITPLEI